ncbi:MAG TPA: hypothetical protein GXX19_11770 [Syntrophomonadaceae bacterium]|nr:hypothetical protein [Syntrophomonadaceae bacterium]
MIRDTGKRGYPPLQAGLATSLFLVASGFAGALCWALISPGRVVCLSSFAGLWLVLACFGGGLAAGVLGRIGTWPRAGGIGLVVGTMVLLGLRWISPGSLAVREIAACLLVPAVISSLGALAGANLLVRRACARATLRRGSL